MPRIFIMSPECAAPTGGIRVLYRPVDTLVRHGVEAYMVHEKEGFRCQWFANTTPIVYGSHGRMRPDDVLVIPEVYGPDVAWEYAGVRKVMFNQNAYLTFHRHTLDAD